MGTILKGTMRMDREWRVSLMDTVYERENGAEHSESSCSLDLSRSSIIEYCTVLLSIVFC